jgi:hypothetical protein
MKKKGPNVGRTGHEMLRNQAAALVRKLQPVLDSPGGRYCLNPEDGEKHQIWITVAQALEVALSALTNFEKTGTFSHEIDFKRFDIREAYRSKRVGNGPDRPPVNRATAIDELAATYPCGPRTIERMIKEDKAKTQANAERLANAPELLRAATEALEKAKKGK